MNALLFIRHCIVFLEGKPPMLRNSVSITVFMMTWSMRPKGMISISLEKAGAPAVHYFPLGLILEPEGRMIS